MARRISDLILFLLLVSCTYIRRAAAAGRGSAAECSYCLSWRVAVEANNIVQGWRTVPPQCFRFIEHYMVGGQYDQDVNLIVDQIISYAKGIMVAGDGKDAWVLDVDDTCISNLLYYKAKRYG